MTILFPCRVPYTCPSRTHDADLRTVVYSVLSDRFMALLSILLIPIILLPFVMELPPSVLNFMDVCDWSIVFVFVAEYASKLYLAGDRRAHFREPWHLVDLVIVVIPFVQFLPVLGIGSPRARPRCCCGCSGSPGPWRWGVGPSGAGWAANRQPQSRSAPEPQHDDHATWSRT